MKWFYMFSPEKLLNLIKNNILLMFILSSLRYNISYTKRG